MFLNTKNTFFILVSDSLSYVHVFFFSTLQILKAGYAAAIVLVHKLSPEKFLNSMEQTS